MARMIPDLNDEELREWRRNGDIQSDSEVILYKAFRDKLAKEFVVFFQVAWILRNQDGKAKDGENDFLVFCPNYGYLCIEVKGSEVIYDAIKQQWSSLNRNENKYVDISNPVKQALKAKHSTLVKIKESPDWKRYSNLYIANGHAVFFPETKDISNISSPNLPGELIGFSESLNNLQSWVQSVKDYWHEKNNPHSFDNRVLEILEKTFAHSFEVKPLVSQELEHLSEQRLKLTNNQIRALDSLKNSRRMAISGGAGTGKTVLAVEKAKRLANEGFKTLLTCYNRQLGDHLSIICEDIDNLDVMNFHQLCFSHFHKFRKVTGRDVLIEAKQTLPGKDEMNVQWPTALSYTADDPDFQYDAIVCDEGQDFKDEFWFAIEFLLKNYDKSPLYVFSDENQNIYSRSSNFPIEEEPYLLIDNCRNTKQIHNLAYTYYKGDNVNPPNNHGNEVKVISANSIDQQVKKIVMEITNLISKENVRPIDISVLTVQSFDEDYRYSLLKSTSLPGKSKWIVKSFQESNEVLIDTVKRFKGLESEIVFLWGVDGIDLNQDDELLYVGISRAISMLYLVGNEESIRRIINKDK